MSNTLFIHAVNVHQGGGERLLKVLLGAIDLQRRTVLSVDSRMPLPAALPVGLEVRRIEKAVLSRLCAEVWLFLHAAEGDCILCFGNLPPLMPVKVFTSVFVQNRYLVDSVSLKGLKFWPRLRITLERLWLRLGIGHVDQFVVQTPSMQKLLSIVVKGAVPVVIAPFSDNAAGLATADAPAAPRLLPSFIYVASGDDHKNHRRLLQAWCLLAADGIRPPLVLTVDASNFSGLCAWMTDQTKAYALNVTNLGTVTASTLIEMYARSDVLIYPSLLESFGLPLIEASSAGLDVVASELDYVRDVVCPVQTFDPTSALSIARAVKRYCGYHDSALQLLTPAHFLDICLRRVG
jgi:glycosyltransferase involved in cell wall biosynthesis